MGDNQATVDRLRAAVDSGDFNTVSSALEKRDRRLRRGLAAIRRAVDREAFRKMSEGYAAATGAQPKCSRSAGSPR